MALRSVWSGMITFSLVSIGVKVYTAIESAQRIAFNQLHKGECLGPVGRKDYCKKCNVTIATKDEIAKGHKHGDDQWVVVTEEEIDSITPQSNKNIQIIRFVDRSEIPDTFFDAPYLAAPDGVASNKLYILFKTVLQHTNKVAIGKVILRDREEPVVISAVEDGLIIQTLRFAREVRNFSVLPAPAKPEAIADQELELATELVQQMVGTFAEIDLTDHYYTALRKMLDQKIAGEEIETVEKAEPAKVLDIMAALRASLELRTSAPTVAPEPPAVVTSEPASPQLTLVANTVPKAKRKRAA
jgi:DNA end-binding protein Ku